MSTDQPAPDDFARRISGSLLRLRRASPFFATLALFARIVPDHSYPTAATDGRDIFIGPDFLASLSPAQGDGLLLHEVLHAALLHVPRRGPREPLAWNFAADFVVNGIIVREAGFELPPGALRDEELELLSVEEAYEILLRDIERLELLGKSCVCDLLDGPPGTDPRAGGGLSDERRRNLEAYWRHAREQAALVALASGRGLVPAGMAREAGALAPSRLPWKSHLWRYLVRTPVDFEGFDRRFLGRGLYLEALEGESVRVFVGVDTSGSISNDQMGLFLGEVLGILSAYPHLKADLFYVDAHAHGPFRLDSNRPLPEPVGGGGTDFCPFFSAVERESGGDVSGVCVYLTDGHGSFPSEAPRLPVLWVVTAGGLGDEGFPWGEVARLLAEG